MSLVSRVGLVSLVAAFTIVGNVMAADVKTIAVLMAEEPTDYGWNQESARAATVAAELEDTEVIIASGLGYGDIRPVMRELAADGVDFIIAHASGYASTASEIAHELSLPVAVVDAPHLQQEGLVADYSIAGHEGAYLAGRLAAKMTRSNHVGIVVAAEPPNWNTQSAGFAQGVRAENADVHITYAVIGPAGFTDVAGGRRVTESVIAAGADVILGQGNGASFGIMQAVETRSAADGEKVLLIDVVGDKSSLLPDHLLSSVVWDLEPVYRKMISSLREGDFGSLAYGIGVDDNSLRLLRTDLIPDAVWDDLQSIRAEMLAGEINVKPMFRATEVRALMSTVDAE